MAARRVLVSVDDAAWAERLAALRRPPWSEDVARHCRPHEMDVSFVEPAQLLARPRPVCDILVASCRDEVAMVRSIYGQHVERPETALVPAWPPSFRRREPEPREPWRETWMSVPHDCFAHQEPVAELAIFLHRICEDLVEASEEHSPYWPEPRDVYRGVVANRAPPADRGPSSVSGYLRRVVWAADPTAITSVVHPVLWVRGWISLSVRRPVRAPVEPSDEPHVVLGLHRGREAAVVAVMRHAGLAARVAVPTTRSVSEPGLAARTAVVVDADAAGPVGMCSIGYFLHHAGPGLEPLPLVAIVSPDWLRRQPSLTSWCIDGLPALRALIVDPPKPGYARLTDLPAILRQGPQGFGHPRLDELAMALREVWRAPEAAETHRRFGHLCLLAGRMEVTEAALEEAQQREPDDADTWLDLGLARRRTLGIDCGLDELRRAIELQPGRADLRRTLGLALAAAGQSDAAVDPLRAAIAGGVEQAEVYLKLGELLAESEPEAARAAFRRVGELAPLTEAARWADRALATL
jgi:hypothetical protein